VHEEAAAAAAAAAATSAAHTAAADTSSAAPAEQLLAAILTSSTLQEGLQFAYAAAAAYAVRAVTNPGDVYYVSSGSDESFGATHLCALWCQMPRYAAAAQRQQLGLDDAEDSGYDTGATAAASGLDGPLYPEVRHELQVGCFGGCSSSCRHPANVYCTHAAALTTAGAVPEATCCSAAAAVCRQYASHLRYRCTLNPLHHAPAAAACLTLIPFSSRS
jgi:hypothetical protein